MYTLTFSLCHNQYPRASERTPDMEFEHKESLLQSGSSSHQESEIDHPFLPGLPPQVVITQPSNSNFELSPPHNFVYLTGIMAAILALLNVCSLICTAPAFYLAFSSKRQSESGDYKSAKSSSITVSALLVAAVVFEAICTIIFFVIIISIVLAIKVTLDSLATGFNPSD
eukprot:Em0016g616a